MEVHVLSFRMRFTLGNNSDNRVLLVEDSPIYQRLISAHLRQWGFEVISLTDGLQAWNLLQQAHSPKLALMDWVMPKMDGTEVCRKLRAQGACESYVYTILLTAKDGQGDLLKAMEAGADDYLVKPFDELELKARLMVGQRILDLQQDLIAAREAMRYSANHDSLTGIVNRREITETLKRELARSKRDGSTVAVALVDVDRFKAINDELGHPFGDEALKEVAERLRSGLRVYDSVGRYGGEEFLLVLPGCDLVAALLRTEQMRAFISTTPVRASGKERSVTVSIGVATSRGGAGDLEVERLLNQADVALYEAKKKGRNRVEPARPGAGESVADGPTLAARERLERV
jgi:two-component system cell cycle response regulator